MKPVFILLIIFSAKLVGAQSFTSFNIANQSRNAIVVSPALQQINPPLILVYHGHYGNAKFAYNRMAFHKAWPQAVVIYSEGLPGTSSLYDRRGVGNGWQLNPGENGDRDIVFTDSVINYAIRNYHIDTKKIFAVGHSNGARFVNVLWATRGEKFAAFVSVAAQGGRMVAKAVPRSIWMSIGSNDPLVPARGQLLSVPIVKQVLGISENQQHSEQGDCKFFSGKNNTELVVQLREAGHEFPINDIGKMVDFMKRH